MKNRMIAWVSGVILVVVTLMVIIVKMEPPRDGIIRAQAMKAMALALTDKEECEKRAKERGTSHFSAKEKDNWFVKYMDYLYDEGYLDPELTPASLAAAQEYQTAAGGIEKKKDFERTVSETVQEKLGFQCGRVFCETYFNEDAKQDVASIIRQIIDVYDNRLAHMEWMTESTRQEARKKLKAITVKVGYPDQWPQDKYSLVLKSPDEGGVYIDNIMEILKASQDYSFKTRHDPVDRNEWGMTPQTVNAYYNPGNNEIVFPAGILQAPFYDPEAEPVANLGGIGAVIGHEITHAFDTSGSQYDEKGNLRDWWTAQDKQHFRELAQKVIDYYDTMEVNGIQVNGTLSVTENIADLGGVSCITEIAKEKGYDLKELYHAYGVIWATKYRDEYLSYIMTNDTHSPGITRVNAVLSAIGDFYTAFGVREGDGMYRRPEDRPHIW